MSKTALRGIVVKRAPVVGLRIWTLVERDGLLEIEKVATGESRDERTNPFDEAVAMYLPSGEYLHDLTAVSSLE